MRKKLDFYAILGVPRKASESEIETAYDHLMQQLESDGHGLDAKQLGHRINLLNQAYWALSDKARRASYDISLDSPDTPLQFSVEIQESRWTSPKAVLNIVGRLLVMGLLIQVGFMLVNFYMASQANNPQMPSEQEHILNGYDAINGNLSPEERAAGVTLADKQRQEAEADQIRRAQEDARRRQEWELEKDRRYADEVSSNLREAEEQIRYRAEEERRRQAELEREKQDQERDRIERLREKWRSGSTNNTQAEND
ncbi:MAG: DnaJ domain-containing protein [Gammaproteobacteria bacterium]|nr:DnaJ domain-containing protein [Gammaproteobacteria bacterium]MBU1732601.1 DnaJ domain-containing protein [Gammaproteobacteria bacterium]MBU1893464.1 DnaJ domain-containing protein [Gammaproteobacteria bacterium]